MWSAVLVGAVVVIISGSSMVYAQQREGEGERGQNPGFSAEDRTPAIDARIAFRLTLLKERLRRLVAVVIRAIERRNSARRGAVPSWSSLPHAIASMRSSQRWSTWSGPNRCRHARCCT